MHGNYKNSNSSQSDERRRSRGRQTKQIEHFRSSNIVSVGGTVSVNNDESSDIFPHNIDEERDTHNMALPANPRPSSRGNSQADSMNANHPLSGHITFGGATLLNTPNLVQSKIINQESSEIKVNSSNTTSIVSTIKKAIEKQNQARMAEKKVDRSRAFSPKDCLEKPLPHDVVKDMKNNFKSLCEFLGEST